MLSRERGRDSALAEGARVPVREPQGRQWTPYRQARRPDVAIADAWKRKELGRGLVEKIKKDLGLK
jgi:hypothetical protein